MAKTPTSNNPIEWRKWKPGTRTLTGRRDGVRMYAHQIVDGKWKINSDGVICFGVDRDRTARAVVAASLILREEEKAFEETPA